MRRILLSLLLLLTPVAVSAQSVLTPADIVFKGAYDIQVDGNDSTFGQAFSSRHVNGEKRFLTISRGRLYEFKLPSAYGSSGTVTRSWNLAATGALSDINGIWFEEAKNRLWVTSSQDYQGNPPPAHIYTMAINDDGTITGVRRMLLTGVPEKRVFGGVQPSPIAGCTYVAGWGGYTSIVASGGAVGPTMYCVPDPATVPDGASIVPRVVLETGYQDSRGVRKTLPLNYFDPGDDSRGANSSVPPSQPPLSTGTWLSPDKTTGLGWMVMWDSYFNTGMLIDTGTKRGFVLLGSFCGGKCYYMSSDLYADTFQFEWHIWDTSKLGSNPLQRPTYMQEITDIKNVPMQTVSRSGAMMRVAGATFIDGHIYALKCGGLNGTFYQYRCWVGDFAVGSGTVTPPPPPPVVIDADAIGTWSAWTGGAWQPATCTTGTQTRTETRTFTVTTAATGAGKTPVSPETRTASQTCTVPTPQPTGIVLPSGSLIILPAGAAAPAGTTPAGSVVKVN